jgi:LacI family transcriptional regulator
MTGMIAKRNGGAVWIPNTALRAEDEVLIFAQVPWGPAHRRVLYPAEDVPAGSVGQKIGAERQVSRGAGRVRLDIIQIFIQRLVVHSILQIPVISFLKTVDFSAGLCNNIGIVTGNDTDILSPNKGLEMRKTRQTVTIQDVAKTAGVSVSTVSRVLNGKVDVASETQERIQSVIEELGYTTNLAARSMRSQKKNLVGLIMPDIAYPFAIEVMKGVNRAIAESEFDLLVYTTGDVRKSGRAFHEQKYVSLLTNSISDGVIIVAPVAGEFNIEAPIISIDPLASNPNYPSVHATNYQGALDAMQYLIGLGHRRIGHISGRSELESSNRRLKGYQDALEAAGIPVEEQLIVSGDYTTETAVKCVRELLSLANPPTAIFASNDQTAIGIYQVADEMGIKIPSDLSVVGFDNISESRYMGLTTVDQFISQMGFVATQMLIKLINGEPLETQTYRMKTKLVIRNSCQQIVDQA